MRLFPAVFLIATVACAAAQQQKDPSVAAAKACASVRNRRVPAVTPLSAADKKWLTHCDEADLYYGFTAHQQPDFAAARRCALYRFVHDDTDDIYDFSMQTLSMIYANGDGVPRSIDLAIRVVCMKDMPPNSRDDYDRLIVRLATMKSLPSPPRYDYCPADTPDWAMWIVCGAVGTGLDRKKREARFAEVTAQWGEEQKAAFAKAREAFAAYEEADEHAENTAATQVVLQTMEIDDELEVAFAGNIDRFEQGKLPQFTHQDYLDADNALNARYRKALTVAENGPEKMRAAEQAWLVYRDAFVTFAKLRWPGVSADGWLTFLTSERIARLKKMSDD